VSTLLFSGRYDFFFDLMPMRSTDMGWQKRFNLVRAGGNLFYRKAQPWSMPLHMQVEISSACQLRCPVCPQGTGDLVRERKFMDIESYRRLLEDVGPHLLAAFLWGWGEPLLNPDFPEMVRIADSYGVNTAISTNGMNLNRPEVIQGLLDSPPTYLIVAIDGLTDESNSQYRVGAKLAPVLEGINELVRRKKALNQRFPILHMRFIVMKHNQHEVDDVEDFARKNGFDMLSMRGLSTIDTEDTQHSVFHPDSEEYQSYKYNQNKEQVIRDDYLCTHAFAFTNVTADGIVTPCDQDINGAMSYGQLDEETSFRDIWFSDRAATIRKQIKGNRLSQPVCKRCPFADHNRSQCSFSLEHLTDSGLLHR
jgi:radical SAM protein with 4Fe4S-binding SPASM domain